jgi:hypothetical protein
MRVWFLVARRAGAGRFPNRPRLLAAYHLDGNPHDDQYPQQALAMSHIAALRLRCRLATPAGVSFLALPGGPGRVFCVRRSR